MAYTIDTSTIINDIESGLKKGKNLNELLDGYKQGIRIYDLLEATTVDDVALLLDQANARNMMHNK